MAQSNQTGTPPAAGASEGQGSNNQGTGQGAEGGNPAPSGGRRLFAGKYETIEDAVEQGIFGMEKAFHQTREDLGRVVRAVEHIVGGGNNQGAPPIDPRGGYAPVGSGARQGYDAYGRGQPQYDPDAIDPTQFIVNPGQVLAQREAKMLQRVAGVVENVVSNAMIVTEFKRANPDLVPHERVVRAFMNETDQTKNYGDRLSDAARMAREYLTNVRAAGGGNANPAPSGGNFVEGPRGGGGPAGSPATIPGQQAPGYVDEEEKELAEYISERNKDIAARFGIKT